MADDLRAEIGRRIHKIRCDKKLSREKVAEDAGITTQFLAQVETGARGLSHTTIRSLSLALGVTADYLLFGLDDIEMNNRIVYACQAFASLSDEERDNMIRLFETATGILRGYKPTP